MEQRELVNKHGWRPKKEYQIVVQLRNS